MTPAAEGTRLLVVDDNPSVASLLKRGLERQGYAVELAASGEEALARALDGDYCAIVLDVMIPEPDGFTVVRRLREAGRRVPVLILTARDAPEDRKEGFRAGANDYLTKPFSLREVCARLAKLTRQPEDSRNASVRRRD